VRKKGEQEGSRQTKKEKEGKIKKYIKSSYQVNLSERNKMALRGQKKKGEGQADLHRATPAAPRVKDINGAWALTKGGVRSITKKVRSKCLWRVIKG